MCTESDLTQDSLPQSIRKLLGVLENVEKWVANSNTKEKAAKESTEKATGKGKILKVFPFGTMYHFGTITNLMPTFFYFVK